MAANPRRRSSRHVARLVSRCMHSPGLPQRAARVCGADRVLTGPGENRVLDLVAEFTGFSPERRFDPAQLDSTPYPAFDLQRQVPYVCLITSQGCPFDCAYCAARYLRSGCRRRLMPRPRRSAASAAAGS